MEFKDALKKIKKEVDQVLDIHLSKEIEQTKQDDIVVANAVEHLKKTVLHGGKRARPALTVYGYKSVTDKSNDDLMQIAAGMELLHTFLLIHDDIMDQDDLRHGVPTMHAEYTKRAKILFGEENAHFGDSVGIIMGDYCYAFANKLIFSTNFAPELIIKALTNIQKVVKQTAIGQFQDVVLGYAKDGSEDEIMKMYENKTARYSFEGPLHVGAILAGADKNYCKKLSDFALPLGIAFQIQDDILGVFGDEEKTGKPVGSDIEEGKKTILVAKAFANANKKQKNELQSLLGKANVSEEEVRQFRAILTEVGAYQEAREEMTRLLERSREKLHQGNFKAEAHDFFEGMIEYQKKREI